MSTLICSFDGLHDNRVLRYCADFEAHTLHMDTQTEAGEKVSVRFTGLLAHWFENVIQDNILFGMDEITVDGFFEQYKDLLGGTISYGFPACCSIEELRKRMEREHIRAFVIDSSLGLCGFYTHHMRWRRACFYRYPYTDWRNLGRKKPANRRPSPSETACTSVPLLKKQ